MSLPSLMRDDMVLRVDSGLRICLVSTLWPAASDGISNCRTLRASSTIVGPVSSCTHWDPHTKLPFDAVGELECHQRVQPEIGQTCGAIDPFSSAVPNTPATCETMKVSISDSCSFMVTRPA